MSFQPTTHGYDPRSGAASGLPRSTDESNPKGINGWLKSLLDGTEHPLWVHDIKASFAMAGSTGQSYGTRSFFPHDMQQQQFSISCEFPNQILYAQTVEFIRSMQKKLTSSMKLEVVSRAPERGPYLKGKHSNISVEGYVSSIRREHERFVHVPVLTFDFIAERILAPAAWREGDVKIKMLKTWKEIIEMKKGGAGFVEDYQGNARETGG